MRTLKRLVIIAATGLAVLRLTPSATALTIGDAYYLGSIVDGIPPGGDNELNWVNELRLVPLNTSAPSTNPAGETLNRSGNDFGVLPETTAADKDDAAPFDTWTLSTDSLYVLGKYGAGLTAQQVSHVWYVGGILAGETIEVPSEGGTLSHSTLFSGTRPPPGGGPGVPDGGATMAMMGLGLLGLAGWRKVAKS